MTRRDRYARGKPPPRGRLLDRVGSDDAEPACGLSTAIGKVLAGRDVGVRGMDFLCAGGDRMTADTFGPIVATLLSPGAPTSARWPRARSRAPWIASGRPRPGSTSSR